MKILHEEVEEKEPVKTVAPDHTLTIVLLVLIAAIGFAIWWYNKKQKDGSIDSPTINID